MPHLQALRPPPAPPCLRPTPAGDGRAALLHLPHRAGLLLPDPHRCCRRLRPPAGCVDTGKSRNLCVDIVFGVPELPPEPVAELLVASMRDKKNWEAGGNCNMAIAAARLGLRCLALGYVGDEIYGDFLVDVLHDEGISMVAINEDNEAAASATYETLLCWALADPMQRHGFCSQADFRDEPAFNWMVGLSEVAKTAIRQSKVLFCNGYVFDELSLGLISSAVEYAICIGTAVFFDPGARGKALRCGTTAEQEALHLCLTMCDVLLLTADEVDVVYTVGCGDSHVAAVACGFRHKMPSINTLLLANAVGAATAAGSGAGRNVVRLEKVV